MKKFILFMLAMIIIIGCDARTYREELRTEAAREDAHAAEQNAIAAERDANAAQHNAIAVQHKADAENRSAQIAANTQKYIAEQNSIARQAESEAKRAEAIAAQHKADADRYAAQAKAETDRHKAQLAADAQRQSAQLAADAQRYVAEQNAIARQAESEARRYEAEQQSKKWSELTDGFQSFLVVAVVVLVILAGTYIILKMMDRYNQLAMAVVKSNQHQHQQPTINIVIPESVQAGMIDRGADDARQDKNGGWILTQNGNPIARMKPKVLTGPTS